GRKLGQPSRSAAVSKIASSGAFMTMEFIRCISLLSLCSEDNIHQIRLSSIPAGKCGLPKETVRLGPGGPEPQRPQRELEQLLKITHQWRRSPQVIWQAGDLLRRPVSGRDSSDTSPLTRTEGARFRLRSDAIRPALSALPDLLHSFAWSNKLRLARI